jgi:hypothetical protein
MVGVQKKRRRRRMDAAALGHLVQWLSAYMVVGIGGKKEKNTLQEKNTEEEEIDA